ncbi:MAG: DUF1552 domain-containing protein, partial [Planctomycetota bacterium]
MKDHSQLSRRNLLRGAGLVLALPAMESLAAENSGHGILTASGCPRRLVCVGNHLGFYPGNFFPRDAGKDYSLTSTLQPLQQHRDDITVFSNLDHELNGGHKAVHGFLTGIKKEEASGFPEKNISLDQVAAEHVGSATRFASINTSIGEGTDMCWTRAGVHVPPVNKPAALFQALFVNAEKRERESER